MVRDNTNHVCYLRPRTLSPVMREAHKMFSFPRDLNMQTASYVHPRGQKDSNTAKRTQKTNTRSRK